MLNFTIRPYGQFDLPSVRALELRVEPYRLEDADQVTAMRERAAHARESGEGWIPHAPEPDSTDDVARWYAAFWVAATEHALIGMVGVRRSFHAGAAPPRDVWHKRNDVAELRRLRVAPEARRQGVGAALTRGVIDWCRDDGCRALYLHTTSPQLPARALYESLGFRDIGHVFTGEYEYVWYEMEL
ncbi:MAG: GNAT family N-acetyltransferase [Dehalococcoidia bacterium]